MDGMDWQKESDRKKAADILSAGGVAVIPTDTLYAIAARAADKDAVKRVYALRRRTPQKPVIVLISSLADLGFFGISISVQQRDFLKKVWPGPVSVILSCPDASWEHVHRGSFSLALRLPDDAKLLELLRRSGPLAAPSANTEGNPPAEDILEAQDYFKEGVDAYLDAGVLKGKPSTLVRLGEDGSLQVLREGAGKIRNP